MIYSKSQIPEHLHNYFRPAEHGLESSPVEYVETMRSVFAEVRRVLADDGTLWLNLGDSYSGGNRGTYDTQGGKTKSRGLGTCRPQTTLPGKNLLGIPWRVAFALQDDGWILRNDIIWSKPNGMPESVTDRLSTRHEHLFMFSKSPRYWFDLGPVREEQSPASIGRAKRADMRGKDGWSAAYHGNPPTGLAKQSERDTSIGRNPGDVWSIPTQPFAEAHFAAMAPELARRAIVAGCKPGGTVLDPYSGSGTTGWQATKNGRKYVGIELNADYLDLTLRTRLNQGVLTFEEAGA